VDGEVVWFWRPDAGAKLANTLACLAGDGGYQARHTEKSTKDTVKTIARGKPDEPSVPVVTNSCAFHFAHEAAGAMGTRLSLHPLTFRGWFMHSPGALRVAAMRTLALLCCLTSEVCAAFVIARSVSSEAIPTVSASTVWIASLSLAMTTEGIKIR
jgi:hypothetical protein